MAELLLDQIRSQIRDRVRELEPVAREYERLEAALDALGGADGEARATKSATAENRAPRSDRRARPKGRRDGTAKRAPRGANRAAVLTVLAERPGVSASELASASGVGRTVLYGLLKRLEAHSEIAKEQLPGGATGYRLTTAP